MGSFLLLSEVHDTSILRTGLPISTGHRPLGSCIPRSGLSRSDFVLWHELRVRGAAAIPSVMGGTSAVLIRNSDWSLRAIDRTRGSAVAFTAATAAFGDAPEKLIRLRISAVSLR